MLTGEQIARAQLADWRKLAQGLHARYLTDNFGVGSRFIAALGAVDGELGHHVHASIGQSHIDLELVSQDAIFRDGDTEHTIEWVTQRDIDLARQITAIAADHHLEPDPASVSEVELGLDTARSATIAPVWATLLTGDAGTQGRGTPSDEVRDATRRVPNLWFGDTNEDDTQAPRFHLEIYVPPETAEERVAAAVAAGGRIVDDSEAPGLIVVADQDGNEAVVCVDLSAAPTS